MNLRAYTRPDRAFLRSARVRFVALAQQRAGVTARAKHPRAWKYATIAIVAVLASTSGAAVFADATNVPATHPLYGFKRMSEQVRMGLSTPAQQVELHKIFAQRRLEEASEIEADHDDHPIAPQSQLQVNGLDKDFQNETEVGLDKAQDPQVRAQARLQFCNDILTTIAHLPPANQLPVAVVSHIKTRCAQTPKSQGN